MTVLRIGENHVLEDHCYVMTTDFTDGAKKLQQLLANNSQKVTVAIVRDLTTEQEIGGLQRHSSPVPKSFGLLTLSVCSIQTTLQNKCSLVALA